MAEANLDALIEEKINDAEFQSTLQDLSDEDKEKAVGEKTTEVLKDFATKGIKNEELAANYKVRAEKAEREKKLLEDDPRLKGESAPKTDLSSQDILALVEVPEEDREEVIRVAKVLGKSIQEARKDDVVKNILSTRLEHRKSADAANATPSRRGSGKVSDEVLLEQFSKGEVPEPGTEEAERLFFLRRKAK